MITLYAGSAHMLGDANATVIRTALADRVASGISSFKISMVVAKNAFISASEEALSAAYAFFVIMTNFAIFEAPLTVG